jgi:hypothetical protein
MARETVRIKAAQQRQVEHTQLGCRAPSAWMPTRGVPTDRGRTARGMVLLGAPQLKLAAQTCRRDAFASK